MSFDGSFSRHPVNRINAEGAPDFVTAESGRILEKLKRFSYYCSASSVNGTLYVATRDTLEQNDPGSNAEGLELKLQITLKVEG